MIALLLLTLALFGCAHLPPTNLSVCGHTEQFETVCRAPVLCFAGCDDPPNYCRKTEEHSRDLDWEKWHVCPAYEAIEGHPTLGSCYVHAGVVDSRQVYRRVARDIKGIHEEELKIE